MRCGDCKHWDYTYPWQRVDSEALCSAIGLYTERAEICADGADCGELELRTSANFYCALFEASSQGIPDNSKEIT